MASGKGGGEATPHPLSTTRNHGPAPLCHIQLQIQHCPHPTPQGHYVIRAWEGHAVCGIPFCTPLHPTQLLHPTPPHAAGIDVALWASRGKGLAGCPKECAARLVPCPTIMLSFVFLCYRWKWIWKPTKICFMFSFVFVCYRWKRAWKLTTILSHPSRTPLSQQLCAPRR